MNSLQNNRVVFTNGNTNEIIKKLQKNPHANFNILRNIEQLNILMQSEEKNAFDLFSIGNTPNPQIIKSQETILH